MQVTSVLFGQIPEPQSTQQNILAKATHSAPVADCTTVRHPPGAFTVLLVDGIATKRMKLVRGREVAIHSAPNLARGTYRVEVAGSVDQLKSQIERLSTAETLVWGLPIHTAGDFIMKSELANLNGSAPATTITRSRDHFEYATELGWMMLDFDYVPPGATLDSLHDLLVSVAPGLAGMPMLAMSSASANIYFKARPEALRGLTGARFYIPTANAGRIPALGQRLFDRLVLSGHGRADISKTGQILFRTPIDAAVWQPERVDYAVGAQVDHPLEQRREMKTWNTGALGQLDDAVLPPLTDAERLRVGAIKSELRAAVKDKAAKVRAAYKAERAAAGQAVSWTEDGERILLEGSHEIRLTGGAVVTVDEILSDPARYHNAQCADPLEPDYGNDDRIAVVRADDSANIFSHAHGGQLFLLQPSREVTQRAAQEAFDADPNAAPPPGLPSLIAQMNEKYVVVPDGIWCARDGKIRSPDRVRVYLASEPNVFSTWYTHPKRARAHSVVFDPARPPLIVTEEVLNTYPGFALAPDSIADCSLFLRHLLEIVCSGNEEHYRWVMSWLAHIVQQPKGKIGTALVLRGLQGCGKSVVGSVMNRILGPVMGASVSKPEHLVGKYNGHQARLLLIEAAEAVWAGDVSALGMLKDTITATERTYEDKFQDIRTGPSYTRILFTSNEDRVVPVAADDRRFTVLDVSDRYAENRPGAGTYWSTLWSQMNDRGCAAFLHVLVHYPVEEVLIRQPLRTEARRQQQAENLSPVMTWLVGFADAPPAPLELDSSLAPGEFRTDNLYADYLASIKGTNHALSLQ